MRLLEWIRNNVGRNYNIFVYKENCRSWAPYQNDYRLLYDLEIKEIHKVKSHKFVFDKKRLMMVPAEPTYNIYLEKRGE